MFATLWHDRVPQPAARAGGAVCVMHACSSLWVRYKCRTRPPLVGTTPSASVCGQLSPPTCLLPFPCAQAEEAEAHFAENEDEWGEGDTADSQPAADPVAAEVR